MQYAQQAVERIARCCRTCLPEEIGRVALVMRHQPMEDRSRRASEMSVRGTRPTGCDRSDDTVSARRMKPSCVLAMAGSVPPAVVENVGADGQIGNGRLRTGEEITLRQPGIQDADQPR